MERLGGETGGSATVGNGNGKGTGEWRELCELLEGVRILRLSVKGSVILGRRATDLVGLAGYQGKERKSDGVDRPALNKEKRKQCEQGILDVRMEWVTHGLHEMKNLREIELLIEDEDVDREVKLAFCAELEFFLTEGRSGDANWTGGVRVLLIEQIARELQGNQATGHGEQ